MLLIRNNYEKENEKEYDYATKTELKLAFLIIEKDFLFTKNDVISLFRKKLCRTRENSFKLFFIDCIKRSVVHVPNPCAVNNVLNAS